MKKFTFIILLLTSLHVQAQIELGLNLGAAINTNPNGNLYYQGDKSPLNPMVSLKGLYNVNDHLQAGLDISLTQLTRKSDKSYPYYLGGTVGGDNKKIVLAKTYTSVCAIVNGKVFTKNGYMYGGAAVGHGVARHNSQTRLPNESYRAPDGGNGLVAGLQIGAVWGASKTLGYNVELAGRYLNLQYDAKAPYTTPAADMSYHLYDIMLSIGFHYRFKDASDKEKELQDSMNVGE